MNVYLCSRGVAGSEVFIKNFSCIFGACSLGFKLCTVMPEDVRGRMKYVACNVGFNKLVVFYGNMEIITNMMSLFTWWLGKKSV
jgi:hypothetical protein